MWGIFREMPFLVKLGTLWLLFVLFSAIYAQLDAKVFNGSLPLADPNLQLNGFNPATGEFGTGEPLESPSWAHPLGTDALARDSFSRAMHGAYVSVTVAIVSVVCGVVVGGLIGSLVGYVRGKTETALMAMIDVLLAFPALVLLLALISIFEVRDLFVISFVIGLLSIPAYTRVSRANSLAISNREFVLAAQAIGTKRWTILRREIIPNVMPTLLAYAMVAAAAVVVVEGSLSFLGLSVQLPQLVVGQHDQPGATRHQDQLRPDPVSLDDPDVDGAGAEPGGRLLPASQRLPRLVALNLTDRSGGHRRPFGDTQARQEELHERADPESEHRGTDPDGAAEGDADRRAR